MSRGLASALASSEHGDSPEPRTADRRRADTALAWLAGQEGLVASVLDLHRWSSMGTGTVLCECGALIQGDGDLRGFPADKAFRHHIAAAVLANLDGEGRK